MRERPHTDHDFKPRTTTIGAKTTAKKFVWQLKACTATSGALVVISVGSPDHISVVKTRDLSLNKHFGKRHSGFVNLAVGVGQNCW